MENIEANMEPLHPRQKVIEIPSGGCVVLTKIGDNEIECALKDVKFEAEYIDVELPEWARPKSGSEQPLVKIEYPGLMLKIVYLRAETNVLRIQQEPRHYGPSARMVFAYFLDSLYNHN